MGRFYKTVDSRGFDFATGRIDYVQHLRTGETVVPEHAPASAVLGGRGLLHAAKYPAEAISGFGGDRFRLLAVDGEAVQHNDADPGFREYGFTRLSVTGELDVSEAFGPDGALVVALMELPGMADAPRTVPNVVDPQEYSTGADIDVSRLLIVLAGHRGDLDRPLSRPLDWLRYRYGGDSDEFITFGSVMLAHRLPDTEHVLREFVARASAGI